AFCAGDFECKRLLNEAALRQICSVLRFPELKCMLLAVLVGKRWPGLAIAAIAFVARDYGVKTLSAIARDHPLPRSTQHCCSAMKVYKASGLPNLPSPVQTHSY